MIGTIDFCAVHVTEGHKCIDFLKGSKDDCHDFRRGKSLRSRVLAACTDTRGAREIQYLTNWTQSLSGNELIGCLFHSWPHTLARRVFEQPKQHTIFLWSLSSCNVQG